MKRFFLMSAVTLALSIPGFAANPDGVYLGTPSYGGTGCPAGTASAALSPDATSLSILFDQYVVQAGGPGGQSLDRKACNIAIPVHVPQGFSVSVFKIDYRGFNNLPAGTYSQFGVEYFFAGARGPGYTKHFAGPLSDNYLLTNTLAASAVTWSPCGQDVILRTNSNMFVHTNSAMEQAMATVDSLDVGSGLIYHFQWQRC